MQKWWILVRIECWFDVLDSQVDRKVSFVFMMLSLVPSFDVCNLSGSVVLPKDWAKGDC